MVHATRLNHYKVRDFVTPELSAPGDFEQPVEEEPEEAIPRLVTEANKHRERYQVEQHKEVALSDEEVALRKNIPSIC